MKKTPPKKDATPSENEWPTKGGSYVRDPKTGKLTPVDNKEDDSDGT